ncbi:MAG: NAD-binding protein [Candidatus Izimaplasma sp.]|nr:NAD-binding protein [Candidatus Izimaplasma bacterium]
MKNSKNKILVVGSGRLGASIAGKLSTNGNDVVIIDKNSNSFRKLSDEFGGYDVVGDATDLYVLEAEALIKDINEVIITTDSDNVNLFIAHICFYIYNVPHIYVRLNDIDKGILIEDTSIKPIYPFSLSFDDYMQKRSERDEK